MTAQHTPGPWHWAGGEYVRGNGMELIVATVGNPYWPALDCQEQANARLIAAAPLMLEALKRYAHDAETFSDGVSGLLFSDLVGDTHTAALSAIRAATGEDA